MKDEAQKLAQDTLDGGLLGYDGQLHLSEEGLKHDRDILVQSLLTYGALVRRATIEECAKKVEENYIDGMLDTARECTRCIAKAIRRMVEDR